MRIQGPNGTALAAKSSPARRTSSGAFSVSDGEAPRGGGATSGLRAVGNIDVLIALQAFEDPAERRRRKVAHGRTALDMLDALKIGMLDGTLEPSALHRLKSLSGGFEQSSGDPGLDSVMDEIELRVEVELAKAGIR
jgi:hypothetical protein